MKTSAPGRIILFSEHAIDYDKLGLATAVDLRSYCEIDKAKNFIIENIGTVKTNEAELGDIFLDVEQMIEKKDFLGINNLLKNDPNICVKYILASFVQEYEISPIKIRIKTQLRKGMAASASVFSALTKALSEYFSLNLTKKQISDFAYKGDVIAHGGIPSGIDNITTTFGGFVSYKKSKGFEELLIDKRIPIVIGDTKIPSSMKAVTVVRELIKKDKRAKQALDNIDIISNEAIDALKSDDLIKLGELMDKNQEELRRLNVSSYKLESLIAAAKRAGAYGAKLSGLGGIMIALCDESSQQKVAKAIREAGGEALTTECGAEGVRLEKLKK